MLRFEYDEARWIPPGAADTPVVVMEFEDVTIREWIQETAAELPPGVDGQVSDFEYVAPDLFQLSTIQTDVSFTASRLSVRLESRR